MEMISRAVIEDVHRHVGEKQNAGDETKTGCLLKIDKKLTSLFE